MIRSVLMLLVAAGLLPAQTGKWKVIEGSSAMDDSRSVTLMLLADNELSVWPFGSHRPVLVLRCQERKTELYFKTNSAASIEPGMGYGFATARLRIDQAQPFTVQISASTDNMAHFVSPPLRLAKQLIPGKQLLFEFTPFQKSTQTVTFQIAGLAEAIKPLRSACGW